VNRKEMLNEDTTDLERKKGNVAREEEKDGWRVAWREEPAKVSRRKRISSIEKNKMFSHSLQCNYN
jgi:hypothetical protein